MVNFGQCEFWDQINALLVAAWGGADGVASETDGTNVTTTATARPSQVTAGAAMINPSFEVVLAAAMALLLPSM